MEFSAKEEAILIDAVQVLTGNLSNRVIRRLDEYKDQYDLTLGDRIFISKMCEKYISKRFDLSIGDIEINVKDFKFLLQKEKGVELHD